MRFSRSLIHGLLILMLLLGGFTVPVAAAPDSGGALVLVNSTSAAYADFAHFVQPYLDHFGILYTVLDISSTPVPGTLDYAVIIVGHRQLDIAGTALDSTEQDYLAAAINAGVGFVNFDNDLADGSGAGLYSFITDLFGFGYVASAPTGANVTFGSTAHYVTEYHTTGEVISTNAMTLADVALPLPGDVTALASVGTQPFLATTTYGAGRAVQWGTYDWMSHYVKGPVYGFDDLVWRSIVWAARKPFVMQGMPPFVTFRQDDAVGPFNWVHIANEYGYKPWVGFFSDSLDTAEIADLRGLVTSGNATASIHAFGGSWFYFDHNNATDFSDATVASNFATGTAWHTANDIPISKFVLGHYYELGTNVFEELLSWGAEFIGIPMPPGNGYGGNWVQDGPFRRYETGGAGSGQPFYYADYLEVPGHPELNNQIFNCFTEIRDVTGYEWYPSSDVTESIRRGTIWLDRPLSGMQLATLFTHEYNVSGISDASWRAILGGVNANIAKYDPEFVTLDYACQYIRATFNSNISVADYDPGTRQLSTTFTGNTDMPTRFYVFTDNAGAVGQFLVDVPAFTGSTTVNFTVPGALDHITVTPNPGAVVAGATRQFSAQGYDVENNPIPGLHYVWSVVNGGGAIDADGLFTAGVTPGTFNNTIAATVGTVTGYASVNITETYIDHFSLSTIASPQFEDVPFLITVTARDVDENVAVTYNGNATLSASAGSIQPATIGPFVNGRWSGYVTLDTVAAGVSLTATDASHTGTSNIFDVQAMRECPCTLWDPATVNPALNTTDSQAVELGVKFRPMVDGYITGIRFYKGELNTGTHIGHLWAENGTMLAEATFINETTSGWQEVVLNPPVAVTANTLYVASYFAPNGHYAQNANYFTTAVSNPPLIAPASSEVGGNGVYLYVGAPGFPNLTYNASNYWVDVVFTSESDDVDHFAFDTISSPKITGLSFEITVTARDANDILVVGYDGSATLSASAGTIAPATTGAFINGQWTGSVTLDQAATGVTITANDDTIQGTSNAFNVIALGTTYSLWDPSVTGGDDPGDAAAVNLGVKFRTDVDGYITSIRFYKHTTNTGTHVGSLWTRDGANLGDVAFTGETASGWQEAIFGAPIPVVANTTYVASYHAPAGHYAVTRNYFTSQGIDNPPLHALQSGVDGLNGVYVYGAGTAFPNLSYQDGNYWVDVVFAVDGGPETTPPEVTVTSPADDATNVGIDGDVTATFNEAIDPATVTGSTFELRGPGSILVNATVSYNASTRIATLIPDVPLAYSTSYAATLVSGASGITDLAGNPLASDVTWTFTTADPPAPPPDEGPGGPILVVASTANAFGRYYAEILHAEGLNAFLVTDISNVDATLLADYDVVILGQMALTPAQVILFTDWVTAGGNLIAMRPDAQLAGLLGLTTAGGTLQNAYLLVDIGATPGAGIVDETIQFHSSADLYTLNGATALANLYSDATTATAYPATTLRSVGTNGGQAAAFTFDLARSIIYTRQGNPAWAGQERDGTAPIRSDDMFYGNAAGDPQTDWINLNKVAIPQADEQQRLLANMILEMNQDQMPLPRFWYFPRGEKAVIVLTGDDHGSTNVDERFDYLSSRSAAGCSVDDWECARATTYLYVGATLSDVQAAAYEDAGFEVALHVNTNCANFTPTTLENFYNTQLTTFASTYPSVNTPLTERTHCIAWSDWDSQPLVKANHGMQLDTNYYYWPPAWVANRPGMFTGSGLPMRFAQQDGTMIDVYQATTQMTDESGQVYPYTVDTLLDHALGTQGYYGAFVANIHSDSGDQTLAGQLVTSAQARDVPVISARQLLTWWDGRDASSFENLAWSGNTLSFQVSTGAGANGLQVMIPTQSVVGPLSGVTLDGTAISYNTEVIKGVEYAIFPAGSGTYAANYEQDTTAPVISGVTAVSHGDGTATITWTTDESSDSVVMYGTDPGVLTGNASDSTPVTAHSVVLTGLLPDTTYYYRVTSEDAYNNTATYPPTGNAPLSFTAPMATLVDTTVVDFSGGTSTCTYASETGNGEVILAPTMGAEFSGTALPSGWTIASGSGGTVAGGILTMNNTQLRYATTYGPGRSLEFVATFSNQTVNQSEHIGFGVDFAGAPWAIFSSNYPGGSTLYARTNDGNGDHTTPLGASYLGSPHRFRIDWLADRVIYFIDGVQVAEHPYVIATPMRPMMHDGDDAAILTLDWMRMTPYATPCAFMSRVLDAGSEVNWENMSWTSIEPAGTSLALSVRMGNTPTPDASWTSFWTVTSGANLQSYGRYIQYQALLATNDTDETPVLQDVTFAYDTGTDTTAPVIVGQMPAPGAIDIAHGTNVVVDFNEPIDCSTITASSFRLRQVGGSSDIAAAVTCSGGTATLNPDADLGAGLAYQVTVAATVADLAGNALGTAQTWAFNTASLIIIDTTVADFNAGTLSSCYIADTAGGELLLMPTVGVEFDGAVLPDGWSERIWQTGGSAAVNGGWLTLNSARARADTLYSAGHVLEFSATFRAAPYQHIGFGGGDDTYNTYPWAMFSTAATGDQVYARVWLETGSYDVGLGAGLLGSPHTYRIEWLTNEVRFYVDGVWRHTQSATIASSMRVAASDYYATAPELSIDWMRMSPYATSCTFTSHIFDANGAARWLDLSWMGIEPVGTGVVFATRTGNTPTPDGTWSTWATVNSPIASPDGRYLQYQATLTTSDNGVTPVIDDVEITYDDLPTAVTLASFTASVEGAAVRIDWETALELNNVGFNLYRSTTVEGPYLQLNTELIPAQFPGTTLGGTYTWLDESVEPGQTYYYELEDVEVGNLTTLHGPISVTLEPAAPTAVRVLRVNGQTGGVGVFGLLTVLAVLGWPKAVRRQRRKSR